MSGGIPPIEWRDEWFVCISVEGDAVIPAEDPSEPRFEPPAVRWMDELQRLADEGRVEELARHVEVYVRRSA